MSANFTTGAPVVKSRKPYQPPPVRVNGQTPLFLAARRIASGGPLAYASKRYRKGMPMKKSMFAALLALGFAAVASAADPVSPTLESVDRGVQTLAEQLGEAQAQVADLQKRVEEIEGRLGEAQRPVSAFESIESRLEDVEEELKDLERR